MADDRKFEQKLAKARFEELAKKDAAAMSLALQAVWSAGMSALESLSKDQLDDEMRSALGGFCTPEYVASVTSLVAAASVAGMSFQDAAGYACPGGDAMKLACPECGGALEMGTDPGSESGGRVSFTCTDCGATGVAVYEERLAGYEDVRRPAGE